MNDTALPALPPEIAIDPDNEELVDRIRAAMIHPLAKTFNDSLETLVRLANNVKGKTRLYMDFAPLSLGWAVLRPDGSCWMAGGLIFHSPADGFGNGGPPSFSVSLSGEAGWQIHS
jgi:hypothetical protein